MSRYEITDLDKFRNGLKAISELVTEPVLELAANGWKLVAMDPANVAMVLWSFKGYTTLDHKDMKICFNLPEFRKILARAGRDDRVSLSVTDDRVELLITGKSTKKFSVPLLGSDVKEQRIPDLQHNAEMLIDSDVFSGILEDASLVGEAIELQSETGNLGVSAEGDTNKYNTTLSVGIVKAGAAKARYSLEYLNKMRTAEKLSGKVTVKFSTDYPLMLEYGDLKWILAPRVENN